MPRFQMNDQRTSRFLIPANFIVFHTNQNRSRGTRLGYAAQGNFSYNLQRNDDEWKTLTVLEGVSHVRNFCSHLATYPLNLSILKASLACKGSALIGSYLQEYVASLAWHDTRSNFSRNVTKSRGQFEFSRNIARCKKGVLHRQGDSFWQFAMQRFLRCKLQENLRRVTCPSFPCFL